MPRILIVLLSFFLLLVGCVPQTEIGFSKAEWQAMPPEQREKLAADYQQIKKQSQVPETIYNGPALGVTFIKGYAMMPPLFNQPYAFQTLYFEISAGECKWPILKSIDTDFSTRVQVCYDGVHLVMDPSRYDSDRSRGTVRFDYNPIWKRGFTYDNVTTKGYARLFQTHVSIKALAKKVQHP